MACQILLRGVVTTCTPELPNSENFMFAWCLDPGHFCNVCVYYIYIYVYVYEHTLWKGAGTPSTKYVFVCILWIKGPSPFYNIYIYMHALVDIFMTRWRLLVGVLKAGLDVVLLDTDVVFLDDPFRFFYFDADFEVMTDHLLNFPRVIYGSNAGVMKST